MNQIEQKEQQWTTTTHFDGTYYVVKAIVSNLFLTFVH